MADVSIPNFFHDELEEHCIYRELTEHCWSDGGGVCLPNEQNEGQAKLKVLTNGKARRKE